MKRLTVCVLLIGLSAGCGGDDKEVTATVSAPCLAAMKAAADEPDSAKADPLITATLTTCATADEWLEALRAHPKAMAVSSAIHVADVDLRAACLRSMDAPVCVDAAGAGRI